MSCSKVLLLPGMRSQGWLLELLICLEWWLNHLECHDSLSPISKLPLSLFHRTGLPLDSHSRYLAYLLIIFTAVSSSQEIEPGFGRDPTKYWDGEYHPLYFDSDHGWGHPAASTFWLDVCLHYVWTLLNSLDGHALPACWNFCGHHSPNLSQQLHPCSQLVLLPCLTEESWNLTGRILSVVTTLALL